uniref:Alpha-1,3-galactosidase n=1 Tax=Prevotella sp. GTC17259 TaxID=3236795 RepID=A0AB33JBA2_9BACT
MMKRTILAYVLGMLAITSHAADITVDLGHYGLSSDSTINASIAFGKAMKAVQQESRKGHRVTVKVPRGRYHFYPDGATIREYYVSNHDQLNPRAVGICMERMRNVTFDGGGSDFIFHGRMLPLSLVQAENCTLRGFRVDHANPHIAQATIVSNDTLNHEIVYQLSPEVDYTLSNDTLYTRGQGWKYLLNSAIAFEPATHHMVYRTSDIGIRVTGVTALPGRRFLAKGWNDTRLHPGIVLAMRSWTRPAPAIFLYECRDTKIEDITIYYIEGMGVLAQLCHNVSLDGFNVSLRPGTHRYFTTQADATHFVNCSGEITSRHGLYESMMDDAINIHGVYLKMTKRLNGHTIRARFMHEQAYGYRWGYVGDTVQFVTSRTMEHIPGINVIKKITAIDRPIDKGVKEFEITFAHPLSETIDEHNSIGVEDLTLTPTVQFDHNIVRNNRARGCLFSTPRRVVCEDNFFDHTSGTAILLCGDCNGWYESGACRDVTIRHNIFVNALTNMFQFTEGVISIDPEIPEFGKQKQHFHSGIKILDNMFDTFDAPLLYAKSVDGIMFQGNRVLHNSAYPAFHHNRKAVTLDKVINYQGDVAP